MEKKKFNIIVSMTTWKARIDTVYETINSILNQTLLPKYIYLVLSTEEFPDKEIPQNLKEVDSDIFKIVWVEKNTKTMKKVFPILDLVDDNDLIINVDDDVLFEKDFIECRIKDYIKYGCKYSISGHVDEFNYGTFFSGCGSLMPKHALNGYKKFLTDDIIKLYEDDWVYTYLHLLNGESYKPCSKYNTKELIFIHQETSSKKMGLYNTPRTKFVLEKKVKELTGLSMEEFTKRGLKYDWDSCLKTYITYFDDKQVEEYNLIKTDDIIPFKGNDTTVSGESINHLNTFYCELTTLYWVWQNTTDELLCFKQYRRPFDTDLRPQKGEIVTYEPIKSYGIYQEYCYYHGQRRGNEISHYLIEKFGRDSKEVGYWLEGKKMYTNNTFIIHREDFNKMCEFVFNILFDLEEMWG